MSYHVGLAGLAFATLTVPIGGPEQTAFRFAGAEYVHRYTKSDLHEFTPRNRPSLDKWADMVTVNIYRKVTDGEALASTANAILETYKANKAVVVRTDSVPRTAKQEAEHLIIAMFPRPNYVEAAFARVLMFDGKGASIVYSHRAYGAKAGEQMSAWLKKNGPSIESELMKMKSVPVPTTKK